MVGRSPLSTVCVLFLLMLAAGCARTTGSPRSAITVLPDPPAEGWRAVATPADQDRLATLGQRWANVRAAATGSRGTRSMAAEGSLLDPARALPRVAPPPGTYDCRTLALGLRQARRARGFESGRPQSCLVVVEDALLVLVKATGSNLFGGRLWGDGDTRMVFLGTAVAREGEGASAYGADAARNRVGVLERVGEFRWRLTMPPPGEAPGVEIIELVPRVAAR